MIAIHTKYIGPTESHGSRIKAYRVKGISITIPYPYELDGHMAHFEAVKALIAKHGLGWDVSGMRYGDSADGRGYSFCFDKSIVN